jgi:hypothetical protein
MFRATFCPSSGALLYCSRSSDQQTGHGKKLVHLGFYTGTGGCGCSLKVFLMMGKMLPETC